MSENDYSFSDNDAIFYEIYFFVISIIIPREYVSRRFLPLTLLNVIIPFTAFGVSYRIWTFLLLRKYPIKIIYLSSK
jgi:hypothetical protein